MTDRRSHISLWALVFAITDGLQFFRGAWEDAVIFTLATGLVLGAGTIWLHQDWDSNKAISGRQIDLGLGLLGALFIITPRHTVLGLAAVILVAPVLVALLWGNHRGPRGQATDRIKRSRFIWVTWAVVTALWEFAANVLGQLEGNLYSFPTISVLLDPLLDNLFGKTGFVVVWILVGVGLIRVGRRG